MAQTLTRTAWFERTTPAKLSRSSAWMWLLLLLCGVFMSGAYIQERMAISNLQQQSVPATAYGKSLLTDFRWMQFKLEAELGATTDNDRARERGEYNSWRDKTVGDIESATRIASTGWLPKTGLDPSLVAAQGQLRSAFHSFDSDANDARAARIKGDETTVKSKLASAKDTLGKTLYPAAYNMYAFGSSQTSFELKQAIARNATLLHAGYAAAAALFALIAWQYIFMLVNCKVIVQGTLVTFLLGALVFGYAYQGIRGADNYLMQAQVEDYQSLSEPSIVEFVTISPSQVGEAMLSTRSVLTLIGESDAAQAKRVSFEQKLQKSQDRVQFLPAAFFVLLIAGLFYKLAVIRALKDYR